MVVCDGADGRFIPSLSVYTTRIDSKGKEIGTHQQPFLWHPTLYHYGRNWKVPGDGEYRLRVRIEAPNFSRHDKINGKRYTQPVEVEFTNVKIKTGQKKS
ncbi:MAG: iron transporter [Ktedonobacteraceae bacterium]|nr:iron transporter [Ktedonobacteraceae bacterium]